MNKVQEESLRTYLFTYSSIYDSLSMEILAEMFELPKSTIHSIVSKMIINEELMVSYACLLTTSGYCYTQCYSHLWSLFMFYIYCNEGWTCLQASLDEPTQSVMMHRTEPSRLQAIALQLSEKVTSLVDNNERLMEVKQGNFGGYIGNKGTSDIYSEYRQHLIDISLTCAVTSLFSPCYMESLFHFTDRQRDGNRDGNFRGRSRGRGGYRQKNY